MIERTGFREVQVVGDEIHLNGRPLRIRGVNRHEDHPEWGPALPEHLMLRDLQLLKDWGGNAIRGAHYPNDQRFLDLCDELGVLFIEEIPLWGFKSEQLASDVISDRAAAMVWAMVERDVSHPCIWAWSVLNECATDTPVGRAIVDRLVDTVHEIDRTRPVTYATDRGTRDRCTDLVDFVCMNAYPGWYTHECGLARVAGSHASHGGQETHHRERVRCRGDLWLAVFGGRRHLERRVPGQSPDRGHPLFPGSGRPVRLFRVAVLRHAL